MNHHILVFGATSAIAQATCKRYAREKNSFILVGRNLDHLNSIAADLKVRGAQKTRTYFLDFDNLTHHQEFVTKLIHDHPQINTVLICQGMLGNQKECESQFEKAYEVFSVNALSYMSLLLPIASHMMTKRKGDIVVIGSVAGDKGRQSNYIYGAAKGCVDIFCQGLRNRLYHSKVHLLLVKPGFVDSPMTSHLPKNQLWAKPEKIAIGIQKAIAKKKDVIYLPRFWQMIMFIITSIPEFLFKRTRL